MEKQLNFFSSDTEQNEDTAIWPHLPQRCRQDLESMFAQILVKYLSRFLEQEGQKDDE
jgi:hypothetical protein